MTLFENIIGNKPACIKNGNIFLRNTCIQYKTAYQRKHHLRSIQEQRFVTAKQRVAAEVRSRGPEVFQPGSGRAVEHQNALAERIADLFGKFIAG